MSTPDPPGLAPPGGVNVQRGATTVRHEGFHMTDGAASRKRPGSGFFAALLATAIFRCWHILILFAAWSTFVTLINDHGVNFKFSPLLLTVLGTVLGFVISYRTTSSFERYNEGRRLWSNIISGSRTFARIVWFHVPDTYPGAAGDADAKRRSFLEKKTMINLTEAFAVAVKHYLRGEDGIYYRDLYHLVKFLPAYALPTGIPPFPDMANATPPIDHAEEQSSSEQKDYFSQPQPPKDPEVGHLPPVKEKESSFLHRRSGPSIKSKGGGSPISESKMGSKHSIPPLGTPFKIQGEALHDAALTPHKLILAREDEKYLLPSSNPPKYHIFDLWPFNYLAKLLTLKGLSVKGKKAARLRAKMRDKVISHNLPLEISLYLSSYVAALQHRKVLDVPTANLLLMSLGNLVDSLTGLERILTTPIPFSYQIHLWLVAVVYCLAMPLQLYDALNWVTIPASVVAAFIFFGFLVAGEEIENPFGYDKNDLNLDHFTNNIIRKELLAITSAPPPDPSIWVFAAENDCVFTTDFEKEERVTPHDWLNRGVGRMFTHK